MRAMWRESLGVRASLHDFKLLFMTGKHVIMFMLILS